MEGGQAGSSRESGVRPPETVENHRGPSETVQDMVVADVKRSNHFTRRLTPHPRRAALRRGVWSGKHTFEAL